MHRKIVVLLLALVTLSSCVTSSPWNYSSSGPQAQARPSQLSDMLDRVMGRAAEEQQPGTETTAEQPSPEIESSEIFAPLSGASSTVKVALLLPLSGQHERLGKAMLNAANIALFDIDSSAFEILPRDTMGTRAGAQAAARAAVEDGAQLILGPVFADAVRGAQGVARSANVNMIAFSTDWTLANNNTFMMGFLPFDQVQRVISFAASQGISRVGVLIPDNDYGRVVNSAYRVMAQNTGIETVTVHTYSQTSENLTPDLRVFTNYDERLEEVNQKIRPLEAHLKAYPGDLKAQKELEKLETTAIFETSPYDAVLMPAGGDQARAIANLLSHFDLPPSVVRRLGTGLLDDRGLTAEPSLEGAWFAAPAPDARQSFDLRYKSVYGQNAPRLASLAYDATALAAILAQTGIQQYGTPNFDRSAITNPNGFAGIDGIFRFRSDGLVERGLAVLQYRGGEIVVVNDAPKTFQTF